ncbi:MAG: two-component system response regulator YehT, partial [Holophaga sp.]|nr:two-component system response regulator YehT [Holophaga sp.]
MLRAVLVDDELHAREELEALLAETGQVTVVGTCPGAVQGLRTLRETRPDVLFL